MTLDLDAIERVATDAKGDGAWNANLIRAHIALCSPDTTLAMVARIRELEALVPTDKERRAARCFVEGNDSIQECGAVMEMLKRIAIEEKQ